MKSVIRMTTVAAAVLILAPPCAWSQQPKGKSASEEQSGLKAGASAPKFTLKDQDGKDRTLDEFVAKGNVALVFYRSADW